MPRSAETGTTWDPSATAKKLHIPTYDEILEKIRSRYPRRSSYRTRIDAEIARLQTTYNIIINKTNFIRDLTNLMDTLHPFFRDLVKVEFDLDEIRKAIKCIAKSRKLAGTFWEKYRYLLMGAETPREAERIGAEARGRMLSQLKRCRRALDVLRSLVVFLSRLPAIDPSLKTIIVAGAPSTGKSTLVASISRAKPRISPYPFTTKMIHVGHVIIGNLKIQVIDTPGILDRPPEEMNPIERKALAAFNNLEGAVVVLIDVSGSPAIDVAKQFKIIESANLAGRKSLYVMINKVDIADPKNLEEARVITKRLIERGVVNEAYEGSALNRDDALHVIKSISSREGWL